MRPAPPPITCHAPRPRFVQQTYSLGNPTFPIPKALATAGAMKDEEILRKLALPPTP